MSGKAKNVRLWHEIVLTLVFKACLLAIIWQVWFSAPEDVTLDDQKVASKILSPQPQKEHEHDAIRRTR
jgi:hypothetical protein